MSASPSPCQHKSLRNLIEAIPGGRRSPTGWTKPPGLSPAPHRCGSVRRVKPTPGPGPSSPPTAITASSPTGTERPYWRPTTADAEIRHSRPQVRPTTCRPAASPPTRLAGGTGDGPQWPAEQIADPSATVLLPGRTALGSRLTLHLPQRWPWETQFSRALARLRAIPLPALMQGNVGLAASSPRHLALVPRRSQGLPAAAADTGPIYPRSPPFAPHHLLLCNVTFGGNAAPQPFHEDVVHAPAPAVHAHLNALRQQHAGEGLAGELGCPGRC